MGIGPQGARLLALGVWCSFSSALFSLSPSNSTLPHESRQLQNKREHVNFKWTPQAAFFFFFPVGDDLSWFKA